MENKKEMRVYIVSYNFICDVYGEDFDVNTIDDDSFMTMAEDEGNVYSLKGFQNQWNYENETMPNADYSYIRFIEV
jgi:hypothetical protein